jgi:hypothetical protein
MWRLLSEAEKSTIAATSLDPAIPAQALDHELSSLATNYALFLALLASLELLDYNVLICSLHCLQTSRCSLLSLLSSVRSSELQVPPSMERAVSITHVSSVCVSL